MSLTLADLAADRRTIPVKYFDHEAELTYRPSLYTGEMFSRLNVMPTAQFIAELVEKWDVLGDDGEPLALDADVVSTLPIGFLRVVADSIIEDVNQGKAASS